MGQIRTHLKKQNETESVAPNMSCDHRCAPPRVQVKKLKELRSMLVETDSYVAVTVRKLVMVSLMEIFKDIVPAYRIRPLTEEEKDAKVNSTNY